MWCFNQTSGFWSFIGGTPGLNARGVYGAMGNESALNWPAARFGYGWFMDESGANFWMYGGEGLTDTFHGHSKNCLLLFNLFIYLFI